MKNVSTISVRAKRVTYPLLAVTILVFVSNLFCVLVIGTSAFPSGKIANGRYLVEEHGKAIELTRSAYWFSYVHTLTMVILFLVMALVVIYFHWTGDMKHERRDEQ